MAAKMPLKPVGSVLETVSGGEGEYNPFFVPWRRGGRFLLLTFETSDSLMNPTPNPGIMLGVLGLTTAFIIFHGR